MGAKIISERASPKPYALRASLGCLSGCIRLSCAPVIGSVLVILALKMLWPVPLVISQLRLL
jgi:hypothetical protein